MRRASLNDGWEFRRKTNVFSETGQASDWAPATLPHDAMLTTTRSPDAKAAAAYFPGGSWEYRRPLEALDPGADESVYVELEGVYRDAVVYVNDNVAGRHAYGYSCFDVRIDHLLHPGSGNELRVEALAGDDSRWYSGAGIHRNAWILRAPRTHLVPGGLGVATPEVDEDIAVVTVEAEIRNESPGLARPMLRIAIIDSDGTTVASDEAPLTVFPGVSDVGRYRLTVAEPRRWRLDDPYLYTCVVILLDDEQVLDEEATSFGIRTLALDARRGLTINGEPVLLRGACVHHDNGPLGAAAIRRADERRVELLKAAGFNAVRSAHNPMSRPMLDACDRLGMLVMDESFDMWGQAKVDDDYSHRFDEWWEADIKAMVRSARNHPSVVLYSIGNEIPDGSTSTGLRTSRRLADKVRSLDGTRFVTQAVTGLLVGGPGLLEEIGAALAAAAVDQETGVNTAAVQLGDVMRDVVRSPVVDEATAEAFAHLDVAGYNYMDTRFALDAEAHPHRVIVATESHPSTMDLGWAGVLDHPNVIGDFTWTGWDYLGEAGIGRTEHGDPRTGTSRAFHGAYPWLTAWCGDLDITGHRRPQSYFREIVFGLRRDPYIAVQRPEHHGKPVVHSGPWSWSDSVAGWSWPGFEGAPVIVEVYADADEVELLLDGKSLGRQPAGAKHRFRAEFELRYHPGELEAVTWSGAEQVGRASLATAGNAVTLEARPDRTTIAAGTADLAFVELVLTDGAGTIHHGRDRSVTVEVAGPGFLQGLGSGNPRTEEPFTGPSCTTFDGRALAVIRPTGSGTITVTASVEGGVSQSIRLESSELNPTRRRVRTSRTTQILSSRRHR